MASFILFDFDGTVYDTVEGITRSVQYALRKRGLDAELAELRCFAGPPLADMFMERFGFDREDAEQATRDFRERYLPIGVYESRPFPEIRGLVERLHAAGKRLGIETFDESMILERTDGRLWMLARTWGIGKLAESISRDGGKTWSGAVASSIPTASTRFFLKRLKSGRVLLVNNNSTTARNNMTAFLSEDDGRTWSHSMLLDKRVTSYPDVAEDINGDLYIIWDRGRETSKEILLSRITERDIMAGELIEPSSYLCNIISKAPTPTDVPNVNEIIAEDIRWLKSAVKTAFPNA